LLVVELVGFDFIIFLRTLGAVAGLALITLIVRLYPVPINNSSVYVSPITQPWLPAEMITLTSRQDIIGYVLSSDGWLEVLMADSRKVRYYHASDILEREICQMNKPGQNRPLITLMPAPAQVPLPRCAQPTVVAKATPNWPLPFLDMKSGTGGKENTCMMPILAVCQQSSRKLSK